MNRQFVNVFAAALAVAASLAVSACSGDDQKGPTTPTPPPAVNPPRLTAPVVDTRGRQRLRSRKTCSRPRASTGAPA